jgi:murein DD-endopeptidase MepM/ murein hydrolase activator NlpD
VLLLSGCSADVTRFSESGNPFSGAPFSNPFASAKPADAAPTPNVASASLGQPVTQSQTPVASTAQPVGGSAAGWTAVGGSPIVVAQGDTLETISTRYGVPSAALLSANGLSSASDVKGGMRIVVPVYHADGHALASAEPSKAKKKGEDVANANSPKTAKVKTADKARESDKNKVAADGRKATEDKAASADQDKTVASADSGKSAKGKKPAIDSAPTGNVENGDAQTKAPLTGAQADASGVEPEFRWPARGRIIQGFKAGGNDGINISVPAGTSVRAAESGVVVYSGDGLKGYGNLVLIKHPNGFVTAYGNNGELDVKRGDQVKRGQVIAKSGDTGNVNAPQLHFELRKGSTPVDPTSYLAGL